MAENIKYQYLRDIRTNGPVLRPRFPELVTQGYLKRHEWTEGDRYLAEYRLTRKAQQFLKEYEGR